MKPPLPPGRGLRNVLLDNIFTLQQNGIRTFAISCVVVKGPETNRLKNACHYHRLRSDQVDKSFIKAAVTSAYDIKNAVKRQISNSFQKVEDWMLNDIHVDDPEIFMTFDYLLVNQGYHTEPHTVETEDGYILTLLRVTRDDQLTSSESSGRKKVKRAVLLVHGFQCAAVSWFLNTPRKSLPHILADAGYDCWVANLRGTPESQQHMNLCHTSRQYWDFSWHEMGTYDVPKMIDYIVGQTEHDSLHYIGHSMGCSVFFVAMSSKPEYCDKVKTMIALGPAVYGHNMRNRPIKWAVAPLSSLIGNFEFLYQQQILGKSFRSVAAYICPPFSSPERVGGYIGRQYGRFFGGFGIDQIEPGRIAKIAGHWPQSTSVKAMCHGMQCIVSNRFQNYDYGEIENLIRYGQPLTPKYDLNKVTCPVATFYAADDALCTTKDVTRLSRELPNVIGNFGITQARFTHGDFIFGKDAHKLVYEPIVRLLGQSDQNQRTSVKKKSSRMSILI